MEAMTLSGLRFRLLRGSPGGAAVDHHRPGCVKPRQFPLSQFWKPDIQGQGCNRVSLPLEAPGKSLRWLSHPWGSGSSPATRPTPPSLCLCLGWLFLPLFPSTPLPTPTLGPTELGRRGTEGESEALLRLRAGQVPRGELTELTSCTPTHQAVCILEGPGDSVTLKSASPAPRWPCHLGVS